MLGTLVFILMQLVVHVECNFISRFFSSDLTSFTQQNWCHI